MKKKMKSPKELQKSIAEQTNFWKEKELQLSKLPLKKLEDSFLETSNQVWSCSNCLQCANCCKNISPIIEFDDIYKMASALNVKAGDFIKLYLEMDEDGDFVFKNQPCPMLNLEDNKCKVYASRPKACREYPHLDQVSSKKMLNLAFQNAQYCGVVYETLDQINIDE